MTSAQLRNAGLYVLWAFVGATIATGLQLAQQLSGTDVIVIRALAATFATSFFGALATAGGASQLTRFGSEPIAAQVDALKTQGIHKSEMVVLSERDAVTALADPFTPTQVDQIASRLLELRAQSEAQRRQPPPPDPTRGDTGLG